MLPVAVDVRSAMNDRGRREMKCDGSSIQWSKFYLSCQRDEKELCISMLKLSILSQERVTVRFIIFYIFGGILIIFECKENRV